MPEDNKTINRSIKYLTQLMNEFKRTDEKILIYGCNGYTATIILQLLKQIGFPVEQFIFSARNPVTLMESLFENLGDKYEKIQVVGFSLTKEEIKKVLQNGISVVLNCAGPFSSTAPIFIDMCIEYGVSYVDITGEVEIFESVLSDPKKDAKAEEKGIVIMPGVGFDVVPSDCILKKTTEEFTSKYNETPNKLELMITSSGSDGQKGATISHGTKKTMVRGFTSGSTLTRLDGKLKPPTTFTRDFPVKFSKDQKDITNVKGSTIPWGDISTGYFSTKVPNIHVYMPGIYPNDFIAKIVNSWLFGLFAKFLLPILIPIIDWRIEKTPKGPSEDERQNDTGSMYAVATNKDGTKKQEMYLFVKEGYQLTAEAALASALRVALKKTNKVGCISPSIAFGSDYILNFDKSEYLQVNQNELNQKLKNN